MGRPRKIWHSIKTRPTNRHEYDPIVLLYEYHTDYPKIATDVHYGMIDDSDSWARVLCVNEDYVGSSDCKPRYFVDIRKAQFYKVETGEDYLWVSLFTDPIKWAYESDYNEWAAKKAKEENV